MKNIDKLTFYTNRSPVLLLFRILLWIIIFDVILILSFSFINYVDTERWFINAYSYEENIVILFLIIHILLFLYLFINWFFDYYKVYSWKVEHITWVFFKKRQLFIIFKLDSITIYQSFLGRLLHYWDISFFYNEKDFVLKNIPYPEEFVEFLELFKENEKITEK
jgi:hypothetical protein